MLSHCHPFPPTPRQKNYWSRYFSARTERALIKHFRPVTLIASSLLLLPFLFQKLFLICSESLLERLWLEHSGTLNSIIKWTQKDIPFLRCHNSLTPFDGEKGRISNQQRFYREMNVDVSKNRKQWWDSKGIFPSASFASYSTRFSHYSSNVFPRSCAFLTLLFLSILLTCRLSIQARFS